MMPGRRSSIAPVSANLGAILGKVDQPADSLLLPAQEASAALQGPAKPEDRSFFSDLPVLVKVGTLCTSPPVYLIMRVLTYL